MSVPEQTPYREHTGNGVTKSFALGFICESKDHLIVLVDEIEPPIATWSLTGGNVVFTTAPAAGKKITLQRNTPFGRTTDYQSFNNSFRPQTVNGDFDRIWWKLQELGIADWLIKLYVDRLHQQQEQEINDLKDYVDDRDDELRAYLMDEIRKQGVALDQLDDYYNYLMQRLAQIAVDKGWDASFVVDASGKTQQEINNGLESIAELRAFNPKNKGVRIYVKSYHNGLEKGGGVFVSTQKSGLVDNGVTIFSSPDPLHFWVRIGHDKITASMAGAKGQRDTDDQPAIQNALSVVDTVYLDYTVAGYRFDSPLLIARDKSLEGLGRNQVRININHNDIAIDITGQGAAVRNIVIFAYDSTEIGRYKYTGIRIGSSSTNSLINTTIDNVVINYPKIGIVTNKAFWSTINDLYIFKFRDYGILLDNNSNNNIINFKQIASNIAQLPTGYYDFDSVTWEQAAIKVIGNQNNITGGQPSPSKYGVIIDEHSTGNVFNNLYSEHQVAPLVTGANSETLWNSSCALSQAQIHPDSVVYGMGGKRFGVNMNLPTKPFAAQYKLNALWLFNEGSGNKVADISGNGNHLTSTGALWVDTGRWGATLNIDAERTSYISSAPTTIVDITQPFHIVACVKFSGDSSRPIFRIQTSGPKYLLLQANNTFSSILDFNGSDVQSVSNSSAFKALSDGYQWISWYFDPIGKTVTCIDPIIGTHSAVKEKPCRFSITAPVTSIDIGAHYGNALDGSISFLGVWQRKLTLQEVTALVNTEDPRVFANTKIESQTDSVATDIDTLKEDYNSLLAKLRKAGIML